MWNSYLQSVDWSVTLPVGRSDGLFDDIKSGGCLYGDDALDLHLQGAVDNVRSESPSKNEDILGREWMESSDLGSFLEVLGGNQDKLLPLEARLIEYTFSTAPDEPVTFDDLVAKHGSTKSFESSEEYTTLEDFLSRPSISQAPRETFDALLSPPTSPEQVAPVIKIEPVVTPGCAPPASLVDLFADSTFEPTDDKRDIIFDGLDFSVDGETETSVVTFDDSSEFISSPLSADDVDSMLLVSSPGSPSTSHSSIIESSPELYKVILTSSVESSKRFSPYSRPKPSKQTKASKTQALELSFSGDELPEPIGEHLSKKDRKKLQNKNAAIRYRMKKKEEALGIKSEEQILEEQNVELRTKVDDLQREIKYMKNLMEDVCRAKGLHLK